ncbi:MAG: hypothetical protein SVM80_10955 [Halobacteriota archaeon]|nr:hypothetical protein [Halobacteriota archaeon]
MRDIFIKEFKDVLEEAKAYEERCLSGKRWYGNAVLIVVDTALDSTGLKYFTVVAPRVERFYEEYVKEGVVTSLVDLSKLSPYEEKLRSIFNNDRAWGVAISISKALGRIREERGLKSDFDALRCWAEEAEYKAWKSDEIGRIKGVGLITFQYLRMQAGIDTSMPDKIIKRAVEDYFGIASMEDISFISEMEKLSDKTGYSQILICWAIWLKQSDLGYRKV